MGTAKNRIVHVLHVHKVIICLSIKMLGKNKKYLPYPIALAMFCAAVGVPILVGNKQI